jgi:hypothetical protein
LTETPSALWVGIIQKANCTQPNGGKGYFFCDYFYRKHIIPQHRALSDVKGYLIDGEKFINSMVQLGISYQKATERMQSAARDMGIFKAIIGNLNTII